MSLYPLNYHVQVKTLKFLAKENHDLLEANQKLLMKLLYDDEDHVDLSEQCYLETIQYRVVDHII